MIPLCLRMCVAWEVVVASASVSEFPKSESSHYQAPPGEFDTNREKTLVPKQSIDRGNLPSDKARMR